ncbi:MAG: DNA mismatch repair endonuclease MutL [Firmicutes bacterium]|nr:DNA mismatch repair endonuclease MutL [Bacillota bacterium]
MKINILPPAIFNLLSAGEVVENPSSVVKECAENAIDAGATQIGISIIDGGMTEISISDNGHGILADEIEKVFLPHATSKIATGADLDAIGTLGFRGEAMSSIAAVSKIDMVTKTADDTTATTIALNGGTVTNRGKSGGNVGTTLVIKSLFFNTPARRKFIKSETSERNAVTSTVQKLILANPHISFRYTIDGEILYDYTGGELRNAIELVYGRDAISNIRAVDYSHGGLRLTGYISNPMYTRRNRTTQTVMINGRTIDGGVIQSAVNDAFSMYMTSGNFPFFVLNLAIDLGFVDVNVHPRKAAVRFEDDSQIRQFITIAIKRTLDTYFGDVTPVIVPDAKVADDTQILSSIKYFSSTPQRAQVRSAPNIIDKIIWEEDIPPHIPQKPKAVEQAPIIESGASVIGTVFDTYILATDGTKLFVLDQHAAHERLLFDKLKQEVDAGNVLSQNLLVPAVVYLTPAEHTRLTAIVPALNGMGFRAEFVGPNSIRVSAMPLVLSNDRGADDIVADILSETRTDDTARLSELAAERLIKICCHSAIRGGHALARDQIELFLKNFIDGLPQTCPHGRPVVATMTKSQMEKMFSRK